MRRLNIGLDVDDVLADFIGRHLELCREMYGKPEPGVYPTDWQMSNLGLTPQELDAVWDCIKATNDFWLNLQRKTEVDVDSLWSLDDHRLFFITSRVPCAGGTLENQTAEWLRRYLGIEYPTVIVSSKKGEIARALDLDYFLDDRPKNCTEVKDAVPSCNVFLKDAAHNAGVVLPGIQRVRDVNEFVEEVEKAVRAESERLVGR